MNEHETEPGAPDSNGERPEDFVAPRTGDAEQTEVVEDKEQERPLENLAETPEMTMLRQQAYAVLEQRLQAGVVDGKAVDGRTPLPLDPFNEQFYIPYRALGEAEIAQAAPEDQEKMQIELEVMSSRFRQDCGFEGNAVAHLKMLDSQYMKSERQDLADLMSTRWRESKADWVGRPKPVELAPEVLAKFREGFTIEPLDEEAVEQTVNCHLTELVPLDEFKILVQQAILPQLNGNGTVFVRGDELPPEYLDELANQMLRVAFPVIAVFNKESNDYRVVYDEGGEATTEEEMLFKELVEACRTVLDEDAMADLEAQADFAEAEGTAYGLLLEVGIDPDQFFIEKGLWLDSKPGNSNEVEEGFRFSNEGPATFAIEQIEGMRKIMSRVEQGEPLTVELYAEYQTTGEEVVKALPEDQQNLAHLSLQLECAVLISKAGRFDDAAKAIEELIADLPEIELYKRFYYEARGVQEDIRRDGRRYKST